jgi:5-hydroxyisourate hydrolase
MSTLSTHVLDSATGRPADGLVVELHGLLTAEFREGTPGSTWVPLGKATTGTDGRVADFGIPIGSGTFRLQFDTGAWFAAAGRECFYPEVIITFAVKGDDSHYHVPLLLAAYAYSTYRGS